jgi:hypothetical protein
LSTTSSRPNSKRESPTRRTTVRHDDGPEIRARSGTQQSDSARSLGILVLAGLMGLTSWVVASLSSWLVPVYVTAMILIFILPRGRRCQTSGQQNNGQGPGKRAQAATYPVNLEETPGREAASGTNGLVDVSASSLQPSVFPVAKPRRVRGQCRKPAKPVVEPTATTPTAWIRIGPGKFVRADSHDRSLAPIVETGRTVSAFPPITVAVSPVSDSMEEVYTTAPSVPAANAVATQAIEAESDPQDAVPAEEQDRAVCMDSDPGSAPPGSLLLEVEAQGTSSSPAPSGPAATGEVLLSDPVGLEPIVEEHGIAPSLFGCGLLDAPCEAQDCQQGLVPLSRVAAEHSETVSEGVTDPASDSIEPGRVALPRERSGNQTGWVRLALSFTQRSALNSGRQWRLSRRNCGPTDDRRSSRSLEQRASASHRTQNYVRRCFSRPIQVHRSFQPRSPPGR